jgi:uncharacterized protein (TIGR02453 family)
MDTFQGFTPDALAFLAELRENNDKGWFEPRKERYETFVREPALQFITAMIEPLEKIAPHFLAISRKAGGSLMRPYRDIRFSADKTPYKTNVGIQFRHGAGRDVHAPGYYVHIAPDECFLGVGLWKPPSEPLFQIRSAMAERPDVYRAIIDEREFADRFSLEGESLKRPPKGFDPDHPLIEELKRKDFIASHEIGIDVVISPALLNVAIESFLMAGPYMRFLCEALGVEL